MIAESPPPPNPYKLPTPVQNINRLRNSQVERRSFYSRAVPIPPLLQPVVSSTPHRALSERGLGDLRRCQDEREQLPGLRQPVLQELLVAVEVPRSGLRLGATMTHPGAREHLYLALDADEHGRSIHQLVELTQGPQREAQALDLVAPLAV